MAVLATLNGITVEILSANGTPLTEYPDTDGPEMPHPDPDIAAHQAARTVSTYIPSSSGAKFRIRVAIAPPYVMPCSKHGFHISVDGKLVWHAVCERPWFKGNRSWEAIIKGVKEGKGHGCREREFQFVGIETNSKSLELPKVKRLAQRLKTVGLIEIRLYRETYGRKGGDAPIISNLFMKSIGQEVPECALKGDSKSHGTALGRAQKVRRGTVWRTEKIDGEDYPLGIWKFMYRSEESLKQLHIVPRTPSPSSTPSPRPSPSRSPSPERDSEGFTIAQRQEMEAERVRLEQLMKVKFLAENAAKESARKQGKESVRIKRERVDDDHGGTVKKRRKRGGPIETIDLTAESDGEEGLND